MFNNNYFDEILKIKYSKKKKNRQAFELSIKNKKNHELIIDK